MNAPVVLTLSLWNELSTICMEWLSDRTWKRLAENFVGHKMFFSILENDKCCILEVYWVTTVKLKPSEIPEDSIRGGVLDISLGGEVRPGPSYPDPV